MRNRSWAPLCVAWLVFCAPALAGTVRVTPAIGAAGFAYNSIAGYDDPDSGTLEPGDFPLMLAGFAAGLTAGFVTRGKYFRP